MTKSPSVLVSIVIPAHNSAGFIGRAVDSVLNQTYQNIEIIVVNDGSSDETGEVVTQNYGDKVRYFYQENAGQATARNTGIKNAKGQVIGFLDADDELFPEMVSTLMAALEEYPEAGAASGAHTIESVGVSERSCPCGRVLPEGESRGLIQDYFDVYRRMEVAGMGCVLVRRKVFEEIGRFCDGMRSGSDRNLWIRIAGRYPWAFVDREMMIYHRSPVTSRSLSPGKVLDVGWVYDEEEMKQHIRPELWDSFRCYRRDVILKACRIILQQGRAAYARRALKRIPPAPPTMQWRMMWLLARLPGFLIKVFVRTVSCIRVLLRRNRLDLLPRSA